MSNSETKRQMTRAVRLGRHLGTLAYLFDWPHRRIVRTNLQLAFPEWSRKEIRDASRRIYQNLAATLVEILRLDSYSKQDILARARLVGEERLQRALAGNKGLIVVSAHLGNWEFGMQYGACLIDKPIIGVAKRIQPEFINQWLHKCRTRFGTRIIYKKGALPDMRQALRRNEIVLLLVDQSRRKEGVDVKFFGHRVPATPAAAFLGLRCSSPVLPIFCIREKSGQLTIHIEEPIIARSTGDLRADVQANTQLITDAVEQMIRRYPEQWFWVHKRWKKYYPHLYPEYQLKRRRRKAREERRERRMRGGIH
jgi:KDO2-lipid IV(A) lauroyltransferase